MEIGKGEEGVFGCGRGLVPLFLRTEERCGFWEGAARNRNFKVNGIIF